MAKVTITTNNCFDGSTVKFSDMKSDSVFIASSEDLVFKLGDEWLLFNKNSNTFRKVKCEAGYICKQSGTKMMRLKELVLEEID